MTPSLRLLSEAITEVLSADVKPDHISYIDCGDALEVTMYYGDWRWRRYVSILATRDCLGRLAAMWIAQCERWLYPPRK